MAKQKMKQKLVVGEWTTVTVPGLDGGPAKVIAERAFIPNPKQPPEPMTELHEIVAWAKKEFAKELGSYEFIREIPGALEVFQQTIMEFVQEPVDGQ